MKILVTGGVRSGKSTHAEWLLRRRDDVTYIAPGPALATEDADWRARVTAHQQRRPATWATQETAELAAALTGPGAFLVDCLGTWVSAVAQQHELWEAPPAQVETVITAHLEALTAALATADPVVLVTNEVGLGVVPPYRSGRVFRDLLGRVNQEVAAACDQVHLVVAGRVLVLPASPPPLAL